MDGNSQTGLLARKRILIVEDEVIVAMELESLVEDLGGEVVGPAHTLKRAVELAAHEDISAAILDLRLGQESIAPAALELEKRHIPFFFYTGQPADDPVRMERPCTVVASKPANPKRIRDCFATILARDEAPRSAAS